MSEFLSDEWFTELAETLRNAGPAPFDEGVVEVRIVFELTDGPSSLPHTITFAVTRDGVTVQPGDHHAADAVIRISYDDAARVSERDNSRAPRQFVTDDSRSAVTCTDLSRC